MIQEIDFQDYDCGDRHDGEEAGLRLVHRADIKLNVTERTLVYLKTGVEDFAKPDDEPSVFDAIIEKAYSLEGDALTDFVGIAVLRMVMVLDIPRVPTFEIFAKAWILDTLDEQVDINTTDPYNDRWFDHLLYPRLSKLAKQNPKAFREFQLAMTRFVSLPDLASQNPVIYRKRPS